MVESKIYRGRPGDVGFPTEGRVGRWLSTIGKPLKSFQDPMADGSSLPVDKQLRLTREQAFRMYRRCIGDGVKPNHARRLVSQMLSEDGGSC